MGLLDYLFSSKSKREEKKKKEAQEAVDLATLSQEEFLNKYPQYRPPVQARATSQAAPPPVATPAFTPTVQAAPAQPDAARLTKTSDVTGTTTAVKERKVAKPIKAVGEVTEEPSAQNYLNKNSFYSNKAPVTTAAEEAERAKTEKIEPRTAEQVAIDEAGYDQAFDAFDSVNYKKNVLPEIKALMAERNKEQETKRKEMRERMTAEGRKKKEIDSAVSKIKTFNEKSPLDFMSLDELAAIYQKHVGSQAMEDGGNARMLLSSDRDAFINTLDDLQKIGRAHV